MESFVFGQFGLQDMLKGAGSVAGVTLPDGSTATVDKIGLQTFCGMVSSEDFATLQDAIDALAVFTTAGTVQIAAGTHLLGTTPLNSGIALNLVGSGSGTTILYQSQAGYDGIQPSSGWRIAHLTNRGPSGTVFSNGVGGIDFGGKTDIVIEDCIIENWGNHGINTGGSSSRISIINCTIRNNYNDGILLAQGALDCLVVNNRVLNNGANGIDLGGASRCLVANNIVRGNGGTGGAVDHWGILIAGIGSAPAANANNNTIVGNVVSGSGAQGIIVRAEVGTTANDNIISSNQSFNNTGTSGNGDGICVDGSSVGTILRTVIVGNSCTGNQRNGIAVDGSVGTVSHTMVSSNSVRNNATYGIVTSAISVTISSNMILDNGTDILDGGTNTIRFGNQTTTNTGLFEVVAANIDFSDANTSKFKGTGNTEVRLQSSGVGRRPFSLVIDQFGGFDIFDITAGFSRLNIKSTGIVDHPFGLTVKDTSPVNGVIAAAFTLDFPNTAAQTASDLTVSLPGALDGYPVMVGPAAGVMASSGGGFYVGWCNAADHATVRFVNPTAGAINPPSGQFIVTQFIT